MKRGVLAVAFGIAGALLVGVSPALAASSTGSVSAGTGILGESYWSLAATPGRVTTIQEYLKVANPTGATETLHILPVQGEQSPEGGDAYGSVDTGIARWVSGLPAALTIAAGKSEELPFTVTIPATAQIGDHLLGISVSDEALPTPEKGKAIAVVERRVVVGLAVAVGAGHPAMVITGASSPTQGRIVLDVKNTGNMWLHPLGSVTSAGHTWKVASGTLLPAKTIHLLVAATGLTSGKHRISAVLTSNGITARFSSTVAVPGIPASAPVTVTKNRVESFAPAGILLRTLEYFFAIPVVAIALGALVFFLVRRRRRLTLA